MCRSHAFIIPIIKPLTSRALWLRNQRTVFQIFNTGVLCQPFTVPYNGGACSGERITFTCVVGNGSALWRVTPGGDDGVCSYQRADSIVRDSCGPENSFTSSQTEGNSNINNSSLSVTLTDDLNGTLAECLDGTSINGDLIGSQNICIKGV